MTDPAGKPKPSGDERVLLILIITRPEQMDHAVTGLLDVGLAATFVEARGLMALIREEMPVYSGLASLLPDVTGSQMCFSLTTRDATDRLFHYFAAELKPADRPIGFTMPVDRVEGLRSPV